MVAAAEAQQWRSAMLQMSIDQLALGAVLDRLRCARFRIDQLEMDEAAAGEMHAGLRLAFAPERDRNVADAHGFGDLGAPGGLQPRAQRRLSPARLACDEDAL